MLQFNGILRNIVHIGSGDRGATLSCLVPLFTNALYYKIEILSYSNKTAMFISF